MGSCKSLLLLSTSSTFFPSCRKRDRACYKEIEKWTLQGKETWSEKRKSNNCGYFAYSRFSRDVTAAMLVYRTIAKKVFWEFDSIIMQNLSDILPLFCATTWPSHHVSESQEYTLFCFVCCCCCFFSEFHRPNRVIQCCTQFKPTRNKTFCSRNFHTI